MKFKCLVTPVDFTYEPFEHELEVLDLKDAADYMIQFCSLHKCNYTDLVQTDGEK